MRGTTGVARATDETKLWLSLSAKQGRNPCSGPPLVYQDLSTCHDWPVEKAIVSIPVSMKGNWKRTSSNSLSPLGVQNKEIGAALRTLLAEVKLRLLSRLPHGQFPGDTTQTVQGPLFFGEIVEIEHFALWAAILVSNIWRLAWE